MALAAWALWDREFEAFDLPQGVSAAAPGARRQPHPPIPEPAPRAPLGRRPWRSGSPIYRAFDLHDHGYWIPLTTLFVLKPDPDQTIERLLMRAAGTAAGLVLATAFAEAFLNDAIPVALVLTASAAVCYAFLAIEYALFTTAITIYMVLLADSLGEPAFRAAGERGFGTAAGILIAALAVALLAGARLGRADRPAGAGDGLSRGGALLLLPAAAEQPRDAPAAQVRGGNVPAPPPAAAAPPPDPRRPSASRRASRCAPPPERRRSAARRPASLKTTPSKMCSRWLSRICSTFPTSTPSEL